MQLRLVRNGVLLLAIDRAGLLIILVCVRVLARGGGPSDPDDGGGHSHCLGDLVRRCVGRFTWVSAIDCPGLQNTRIKQLEVFSEA